MNPDEETPATARGPLAQPQSEQTIRLLNFHPDEPATTNAVLAEVDARATWPSTGRLDTLREIFSFDHARDHEAGDGAYVLVSRRHEMSEPTGREASEGERTPGYPTAHAATYAAHLAALGGAFLSVVTAALQTAPDDEAAHIYRGMACRALQDWHAEVHAIEREMLGDPEDEQKAQDEALDAFKRAFIGAMQRRAAEAAGKTPEGDLPA